MKVELCICTNSSRSQTGAPPCKNSHMPEMTRSWSWNSALADVLSGYWTSPSSYRISAWLTLATGNWAHAIRSNYLFFFYGPIGQSLWLTYAWSNPGAIGGTRVYPIQRAPRWEYQTASWDCPAATGWVSAGVIIVYTWEKSVFIYMCIYIYMWCMIYSMCNIFCVYIFFMYDIVCISYGVYI